MSGQTLNGDEIIKQALWYYPKCDYTFRSWLNPAHIGCILSEWVSSYIYGLILSDLIWSQHKNKLKSSFLYYKRPKFEINWDFKYFSSSLFCFS